MTKCKLCLRITKNDEPLCKRHRDRYIYDKDLGGYRLKKVKNGTATRHIKKKFHSHEIELTKILERYYGIRNVVTSFHPVWALSKKGALLEFDIFITNKNVLIEYNGQQHYEFVKLFHKTEKKFQAQKERDILKERLAKDNGFKFVIIKYDEPLVEDYIISKVGT